MSVWTERGDITKLELDAIVNAANSYLSMGGGVAGAIRRAGGQEIETEAMAKGPVPVGEAIETEAGRLRAKYVIHAPTMETPGPTNVQKVAQATKAALDRANKLSLSSIAIPGMGTGVGGVSVNDAAEAVVNSLVTHVRSSTSIKDIVLIDVDDEMVQAFRKVLDEIA